jgi:hypothetical protein
MIEENAEGRKSCRVQELITEKQHSEADYKYAFPNTVHGIPKPGLSLGNDVPCT